MLTTAGNTAIYVGVTSNLMQRIRQHKDHFYPGSFTARYDISKLVYYCFFERIDLAIAEEKRLKAGNRKQKENLINSMNPDWRDLFLDLVD